MAIVSFSLDNDDSDSRQTTLASRKKGDGDASANPFATAQASIDSLKGGDNWLQGRSERIKSLEAALDASRRRQRTDLLRRSMRQGHDYTSLLDNEQCDTDSDNSDTDTSSDFYGEGQPLLRTYNPPDSSALSGPSSVHISRNSSRTAISGSGYGATSSVPEATRVDPAAQYTVKTPDQYLPWSVRISESVSRHCASICCACARNPEDGN